MRFNIFYIFLILAALALIPLLRHRLQAPDEFFGIAETMSRNMNFPYPVLINKLFVQIGQSVNQGDTILVLERTDYQQRFVQLQYDMDAVNIKKSQQQLKAEHVSQLYTIGLKDKREEYIQDLFILNKEKNTTTENLSGLEKVKIDYTQFISDINKKIEYKTFAFISDSSQLAERYQLEKGNINREINSLEIEFKKIQEELMNLQRQSRSLIILAPEDGIIGQIDGQAGDAVPAYNNIIKIYGTHPNLVTSYIGDGHISSVKLGDSAEIQSLNDPNYKEKGVIFGLGSRITPFPERLKKIPELRLWGREVQINISLQNHFLQGEKVKVLFHGQ